MEALRKVLVCIGALLSLAITAVTALALVNHAFASQALDYLNRCFLYNLELCFLQGRNLWQPILVGAIFLVIGILLLIAAFARKRPPRRIRVTTADGNYVDISIDAIDTIVRRAAASVPEICNLVSRLHIVNNELWVNLRVVIPAGTPIPGVGEAVREQVNSQMQAMVGIQPKEIRVEVANVSEKKANGEVS